MFGIGTWELIVILILALIVLGPEKLPDMARKVGRTVARLRHTAEEVKREIDLEGIEREISQDGDLAELQESLDLRAQMRRALADLEPDPTSPAATAGKLPPPSRPDDGPPHPLPPARDPDGPASRE
jgi:Tat protein translocase TatB subunit